jgi:toxin FitB
VVLEVYRKIKKDKGEEKALEAYAHLDGTIVVPLDIRTAVAAADIGLKTRLGTVDSIIYAVARHYKADLITGDHHFQGLEKVTLIG